MERRKLTLIQLAGFAIIVVILVGCNIEEDGSKDPSSGLPDLPQVITHKVKSITFTTVSCTGATPWPGRSPVTDRGFIWRLPGLPVIKEYNIHIAHNEAFTATLTGLSPNTLYQVQAFATNSYGVANGNSEFFATLSEKPVVTTSFILDFNSTSAIVGGNIQFEGSSEVTESGVYWSLSTNPEVSGTKQQIESGSGPFSQILNGLNQNTTYYVKAYANNTSGTGYGLQYSFNTGQDAGMRRVTDIDKNIYHYITIGDQVWMVENLKTTKYRDNTDIAYVTDNWGSATSGAFCWYNNDVNNKNIYGALYNFHAISDNRKICPAGWHIPSDNEWNTLLNYLGGETVAGFKLRETGTEHWSPPLTVVYPAAGAAFWTLANAVVTNETGFTALPGGSCDRYMKFDFLGITGYWWTSTEYNSQFAWIRLMGYGSSNVYNGFNDKSSGYSVRCLKD